MNWWFFKTFFWKKMRKIRDFCFLNWGKKWGKWLGGGHKLGTLQSHSQDLFKIFHCLIGFFKFELLSGYQDSIFLSKLYWIYIEHHTQHSSEKLSITKNSSEKVSPGGIRTHDESISNSRMFATSWPTAFLSLFK